MDYIIPALIGVLICFYAVGVPTLIIKRKNKGKQLIIRHIEDKGGHVKDIRFQMTALRSEYHVTYTSKDNQDCSATCITWLGKIYWASDTPLE